MGTSTKIIDFQLKYCIEEEKSKSLFQEGVEISLDNVRQVKSRFSREFVR